MIIADMCVYIYGEKGIYTYCVCTPLSPALLLCYKWTAFPSHSRTIVKCITLLCAPIGKLFMRFNATEMLNIILV